MRVGSDEVLTQSELVLVYAPLLENFTNSGCWRFRNRINVFIFEKNHNRNSFGTWTTEHKRRPRNIFCLKGSVYDYFRRILFYACVGNRIMSTNNEINKSTRLKKKTCFCWIASIVHRNRVGKRTVIRKFADSGFLPFLYRLCCIKVMFKKIVMEWGQFFNSIFGEGSKFTTLGTVSSHTWFFHYWLLNRERSFSGTA